MGSYWPCATNPSRERFSLPTDTVWVSGDEVRIQQVLVNVLANALDACSRCGDRGDMGRRWRFILRM